MVLIREIAQQAMTTGYLTVESENLLRRMLTTTTYELEDLNAFMSLQLAAMSGLVKQESRELKECQYSAEVVFEVFN
ncbi:hypothetical protein [Tychonema sp. BBK16]|uniref:hypothetical protein n=1 Tax=Tychonema sp. BBK16 TaxID=2699888 RepID=UPI001F48285A|nr:hypothetical protein [Tychonema sp. BBK16]MCF6375193.1 hypothetical protein [Tychonema sp. BBK16]